MCLLIKRVAKSTAVFREGKIRAICQKNETPEQIVFRYCIVPLRLLLPWLPVWRFLHPAAFKHVSLKENPNGYGHNKM